jgi:hypothetical protein
MQPDIAVHHKLIYEQQNNSMACFEKSSPSVMKDFSPFGKETLDEYEEAEATPSRADRSEAA